MISLPAIRFLCKHQSPHVDALIQRLVRTGLWNIFNPSIASTPGGIAIAFRAGRWPGDKPFRAFYLPPGSYSDAPIDLTKAFESRDIAVVSDPKLASLGNELWVTFNTGHFEKPNRVFVARLYPEVSDPYELVLPERQTIEKNWALFLADGALHAVYSVRPLVILRVLNAPAARQITFERVQFDGRSEPPSERESLTLGSQLAALDSSGREFAAIVHQKFHWGKRRAYLGLPARIRRVGDVYNVIVGRSYLAHSPRALFGDSIRHNPNLLSCTYFSGLVVVNDRALIGYGINDVSAGFADVPAQTLGLDVGT
jgi:hypothetical protein